MPDLLGDDSQLRSWQKKQRELLVERAGSGVLDVPNLQILRFTSAEELYRGFESVWGQPPAAVVIPIASPDGVNVTPSTAGLPISRAVQQFKLNFTKIVKDFKRCGCEVIIGVDPTFPFVNQAQYHLIDTEGSAASQVCIGKAVSRTLVGLTTADALAACQDALDGGWPTGILFDTSDLWPMGADKSRISLTCFCDACSESLNQLGVRDALPTFRTFPSPANLLLSENEHGDGISYIDTVRSTSTPDEVLGLSRLRRMFEGLDELSEEKQTSLADSLLAYLRARHDQTIDSIRKMYTSALEFGAPDLSSRPAAPQLILLTEGVSCGWTSGILLDRLDSWTSAWANPPCDELWFDPTGEALTVTGLPYRSYMWRRSRYIIDSFFQFAVALADPGRRATTGIGRLPVDVAREILLSRLHQTLGGEMGGLTSLLALPPLGSVEGGGRVGYVGVALDESIGSKITDSVEVAPEYRGG